MTPENVPTILPPSFEKQNDWLDFNKKGVVQHFLAEGPNDISFIGNFANRTFCVPIKFGNDPTSTQVEVVNFNKKSFPEPGDFLKLLDLRFNANLELGDNLRLFVTGFAGGGYEYWLHPQSKGEIYVLNKESVPQFAELFEKTTGFKLTPISLKLSGFTPQSL